MSNSTIIGQQETSYWNILKDLSADVKLRLIARLSASLVKPTEKAVDNVADKYYGAWHDDSSAEDMADNIRKARINGIRVNCKF